MALPTSLHAVKMGAEHIPDKAFEKIPYVGPRYFEEKDGGNDDSERKSERDQQNRSRRDRDSRTDPENRTISESDSEDEAEKGRAEYRARRRQARRERRAERKNGSRDGQWDRGYQSDAGPRGFEQVPYFPPPPRVAVGEPVAAVGEQPGRRGDYYEPPHTNPSYDPLPYQAVPQPARSVTPERYRPAYMPYQNSRDISANSRSRGSNPGSPHPPYPSTVAVRPDYGYPPQNYVDPGYNTYQPPQDRSSPEPYHHHHRDRYSESSSSSRDRGSKDRTKSNDTHRPGSRVREQLSKHKDVGASALGALAGGLIGNELGGGRGKIGLLVGAAIGGVGGNVLERKREEDKRRKQDERRAREDDGYDSY
jgi:hypothetical protein